MPSCAAAIESAAMEAAYEQTDRVGEVQAPGGLFLGPCALVAFS